MVRLNEDILYLIFEELKDDNNALYSCLSTNRTWCKVTIPILWKNPWKFLNDQKQKQNELLLNVISLHLTNESRNILKNILPFLTNLYQKPLFDYIRFCKHLDLIGIEYLIQKFINKEFKNILMNEIINIFINGNNRKFTHLYIPDKFNFQIHLIPGARSCLSEIEFLSCGAKTNDDIFAGLAEICKSIKKLKYFINYNGDYGIIRLIEVQKNLYNLDLEGEYLYGLYDNNDKPLVRNLENSLIKHANNIQYLNISNPNKIILTSFVNLKVLELDCDYYWTFLKNLSLPFLQILRIKYASIKDLIGLIENTSGYLIEIKFDYVYNSIDDNKRFIQVIYQKCPNLIFLKSVLRNSNILEFENLLVNCQYLNGLYIIGYAYKDRLFEILTKSSPKSLFKFKFRCSSTHNLNCLKLFFDNWKGRNSMYLQSSITGDIENLNLVIEKYKSEVVKKFNHNILGDDFEWI